ncbi:sulfite reductase [Skermanella aerolata]|uniref:Sulfite reductase n=1 Tax=Skermanella aerolata TaxID=393310 RepID=A0A512E1R2_9PROT|nr:PepSY domain-containing protein [Skermanella aerolata]KJB91186.1 peptidase [Skermanella aerolata KACC 11604]GEO42659.1 sulfite reductase [Skermanella aerolata]
MTHVLGQARPYAAEAAPAGKLYRAIWRWHFYAGLLAVPFMILLAVTGSLYLFKDEIDNSVFAYRNVVAEAATPPLPVSVLAATAADVVPGSAATVYRTPRSATGSAMVTVKTDTDGDSGGNIVFLNPYSGAVLDVVPAHGEFQWVVKRLHSLEYFGDYTNRIIEAVGGFALVLVVTGIYLWWPRGQSGGVLTVRAQPAQRVFWRDLHAVTGAVAGLVIFFLALSGMPWSGYWGNAVNKIASDNGVGYPKFLWDDVPVSKVPAKDALGKVGWTVENAPMPLSGAPSGGGAPVGIDRAVEVFKARGIGPGFDVTLPDGKTGVYSASLFPDMIQDQRMIHLDQYTGEPLVDLNFADYGGFAKAVELGINIHMGQEFGLANQLLMLTTCLAIILTSVAAVIMWWKRRPSGKLGIPPYPRGRAAYIALWVVAAIFGIAFPITGLAILAMLLIDAAIMAIASRRRSPA